MEPQDDRTFRCKVVLQPGIHMYRYIVDGDIKIDADKPSIPDMADATQLNNYLVVNSCTNRPVVYEFVCRHQAYMNVYLMGSFGADDEASLYVKSNGIKYY